ncbi:hypothetical protein L596_017190 [Steinernema carpocapsae]|uniref:Uncharacterized protein n=1 Tax=Steinernema carpocapsae TaxID=34508 RepID=A0A4U5N197_STECR|nr:hypothetical protein L596_017190 [Steinernema carpocapsae]
MQTYCQHDLTYILRSVLQLLFLSKTENCWVTKIIPFSGSLNANQKYTKSTKRCENSTVLLHWAEEECGQSVKKYSLHDVCRDGRLSSIEFECCAENKFNQNPSSFELELTEVLTNRELSLIFSDCVSVIAEFMASGATLKSTKRKIAIREPRALSHRFQKFEHGLNLAPRPVQTRESVAFHGISAPNL